jgi:hypothetical protein
MAAKRGLTKRLQEQIRKRQKNPRPQSMPTGNVRSDRWDEITTHHADVLQDIEMALLETWRDVSGTDDHWVHLGLVGAMRDDATDHPCSLMVFTALKKLRERREDVDDDLWLDALRVVDQSVRDHSSLRHGDRSYLTFILPFLESERSENRSDYQVSHDRIQRPALAASPAGDVEIGFAWYRREQWPLLRSLSVDSDRLEETYDEWLAFADKTLETLRCQGVRAEKVDLDVHELSAWCKRHGCPLDGDARAAYVSERMSQQ